MALSLVWNSARQSAMISKPSLTEENLADQTGRVHIVTGGYAGVGKELTDILYQHNATVYVAGRNRDKATAAMDAIRAAHPASKGRLEFLPVDLSDLTTIGPAVRRFTARETRLDVLVNNAGVMVPPWGSRGRQGRELQLVTNCLGPFLLTKGLVPVLRRTAAAGGSPAASVRVLWASSLSESVSSPAGGGVAFGEDGAPAEASLQLVNYAQSKAANHLYAAEFSRRYGGDGILSVAFNPGNLKSELARHAWFSPIVRFLSYPCRYGAYTELYAGWSPDLKMDDGGMFVIPWGKNGNHTVRDDIRQAIERAGTDETSAAARLWAWSEKESSPYA